LHDNRNCRRESCKRPLDTSDEEAAYADLEQREAQFKDARKPYYRESKRPKAVHRNKSADKVAVETIDHEVRGGCCARGRVGYVHSP